MNEPKSKSLEAILESYQQSFSAKVFGEESSEEDDLMLVFGLTQGMKAENKQYWGPILYECAGNAWLKNYVGKNVQVLPKVSEKETMRYAI